MLMLLTHGTRFEWPETAFGPYWELSGAGCQLWIFGRVCGGLESSLASSRRVLQLAFRLVD